MRRLIAVLLCSGLAIAGDFVVRVTVGVEPAPDAVVTIVKKGAGIVFDSAAVKADAKTDATGQAVVRVEAGDQVLVYKPGFELAVAETTGDLVDVALRPERVFDGLVFDAQEKPLGGVEVFFATRHRREATFRARSGEDGRFFVYGLWFDDYELRVEKGGYSGLSYRPDGLEPVRLTMLREASLAGVVHDVENKPLPGIVLELDGRETKTDAKGAFRFDRCWAGAHGGLDLRARPPYRGRVRVEPFADGEQRTLPPLRVEAPVTVRLRVLGEDKAPIAGVETLQLRERSDENGRLRLLVVPGQDADIHLSRDGLAPERLTVDAKGGGAVVDLGDVVMRPLPRIEVQVRHPDGTLVAGGTIGDVALVKGVAVVVGAGPEEVVVEGYPPVWAFVAPPGPVSVTLPEPVWVNGRVLDFADEPFRGIEVYSATAETTTDEEGRFRLGPVSPDDSRITAESGEVKRTVQGEPGDTELEIRMPRSRPDLVRGRVMRGANPVTRFELEGRAYVDEEGRFEIVVDRTSEQSLSLRVAGTGHVVPLPPAGEDAIVRLPAGRLLVTVDGPTGGVELLLHGKTASYAKIVDGVAVFDMLAPGRYRIVEDGGASRDVDLAADEVLHVSLPARVAGFLTVETGGAPFRKRVAAGRHESLSIDGLDLTLRDLRMPAEDLRIDLVTGENGALVVRARADLGVWVERRFERCTAVRAVTLDREEHRFAPLRVGAYDVICDGIRRRVVIERGRTTTAVFDDERVSWSGRVQFERERPGAGALVVLELPGTDWSRRTQVDMRGRFRFDALAPGSYRCTITHEDYTPDERTVDVAEGAAEPTFLLRRPTGRVAFVGPSGTALRAGHAVRVDGVETHTGPLGDVPVAGATARIDLDVEGYASLRGTVVRPGETVRLQWGASLALRTDASADRIQVRVGGVPFDRLEAGDGGFVLDDLPAGLAEIEIAPEDDEEEPRIVRATLRPGVETRVDLGAP